MEIKFDKRNTNVIMFIRDGRVIHYIALPQIEKGCDIINFTDELSRGYTFNFQGLIVITTKEKRELYCQGELIDSIKRK